MKLKDVLAISGQGGLFKFVAQSRNGIIVESLADGTRTCAPATARVSSLGEIAIFTDGEDMPLAEVFQKIYEKCEGKQTIDPKSPAEALKKYFAEVLPEYDRSRVHVSDMKKMATWYNLLVASGMTEFKTGNEESQEESGETANNRNAAHPDVIKRKRISSRSVFVFCRVFTSPFLGHIFRCIPGSGRIGTVPEAPSP